MLGMKGFGLRWGSRFHFVCLVFVCPYISRNRGLRRIRPQDLLLTVKGDINGQQTETLHFEAGGEEICSAGKTLHCHNKNKPTAVRGV